MTEEYQRSLDFWQKAFVLEEEGKESYLGKIRSGSDEEWSEIFGRYFHVLKIDHFARPKEETERRRIFFLARKA